MKKLIISCILSLVCSFGHAQVNKWRAKVFSLRYTTENDLWTDWSSWSSSGVLITGDITNQRVKVFAAAPKIYDMIESVVKDYDNDGNPIYSVACVDENAKRCNMIWYHTQEKGSFVIFKFADFEIMYSVVQIDDN